MTDSTAAEAKAEPTKGTPCPFCDGTGNSEKRAPGHGVVLIGMGEKSRRALHMSGLGLCVDLRERKYAA